MNREEGGRWPGACDRDMTRPGPATSISAAGGAFFFARGGMKRAQVTGFGETGAGGRFQRQRCATSQSPLQLSAKGARGWDAERERLLRDRESLGHPMRSTGQPSVPCPSPPRRLADRGWPACASMLVAGGFESFASVSIHRSDRLPPPCSSSATTVAATSPPRTRRDARKATRSVQRPWWPTSRRGSCSLISTYSYMAEKKGLPYRCLALPFCASIGRARECVVGSRLGFETWPRTKSGAREGSPFGSFPPTPNAMMRLCAFRTDPARRGMFVCFDVSRSNRCGHGVVVVGRWTR